MTAREHLQRCASPYLSIIPVFLGYTVSLYCMDVESNMEYTVVDEDKVSGRAAPVQPFTHKSAALIVCLCCMMLLQVLAALPL